jgi:hypothetical protein
MLDALYYSMLELRVQRERPVIVVLTDGVDTSSVLERLDVLELVERTPELSVFSIGLGLPYTQMFAARSPTWWVSPPGKSRGVNSTKRFLQRLATRTNGRFFDVDASSKLERVFLRVREMLENEGTLSVVDPEPDAADPGRLKVSSRNSDCSVLVFQAWGTTENDQTRLPIIETSGGLPRRFVLPARRRLPVESTRSTTILADPTCSDVFRDASVGSRPGGPPDGFVEVDKYGMRGCGEDVTLQYGVLYEPKQERKVHFNRWVGLKTRPFEMPVPMVTGLPTDPVTLMDSLAEMALAAAGDPIETDPRFVPADAHARPYHDLPCFADGASFLEVRSWLARVLYARPDYRYWVLDRLRRDSEVAMSDLEEVYRRRFPDTPEEVLKEVVRETDEGREILDLARAPAEIDLQRYLGAWLADVSVHDLFVGWEVELVNRALASAGPSDFEAILESWEALRDVLFAPSYNRVLALLIPGYDPDRDRIGYWRVVLPRPSWIWARLHGLPGKGNLAEVPLDLERAGLPHPIHRIRTDRGGRRPNPRAGLPGTSDHGDLRRRRRDRARRTRRGPCPQQEETQTPNRTPPVDPDRGSVSRHRVLAHSSRFRIASRRVSARDPKPSLFACPGRFEYSRTSLCSSALAERSCSTAIPILLRSGSKLRISTATSVPGETVAFHPSLLPV